MSGRVPNEKTEKNTRAAFYGVALVLILFGVFFVGKLAADAQWRRTAGPTQAQRGENAGQTQEEGRENGGETPVDGGSTVLAFFGSAADPLCAPLYQGLQDFCTQHSWRLISYDCRKNATNQIGQIEDFLRRETANIAVLYSFLEPKDLNEQAKTLHAVCPLVTVGDKPSSGRSVTAHIGWDETEQIRVLAQYFSEKLKQDEGVLLLTDGPDEMAERRCIQGFSKENVEILDKNYSWLGEIYVERYLNTALENFPAARGVVCTSTYGTRGTLNSLNDRGLRDSYLIASLSYDPSMADDLALGGLDAAVAFSANELVENLTEILQKAIKSEDIEEKQLTPVLLTPENIDTIDLGY